MNLQFAAAKAVLGDAISGIFKKISTLSSIEWAAENVRLTLNSSTVDTGKFNALIFPALEYIYDCLDNPKIPIIYCIKSARFGWTTMTIVWLAKTIVEAPRNILFGFGTKDASLRFYKDQWFPFIQNIPSLLKSINVGVALSKISWNHTPFYGGYLRFISTGVSANIQSANAPIIILEEPDLHKVEADKLGNILELLIERMKLVPLVMRKLLVGGTSSYKETSLIYRLVNESNDLVFKAECHECKSLIPMDYTFFKYLQWEVWEDGREHKQWGKYNPATARWYCPECNAEWTDLQKNQNILAGKKHGFIDHTGKFSKGWHPTNPNITEVFGFRGSECLSPLVDITLFKLDVSSFAQMSKKILAAEYAALKGDESKLVVVWNNMFGWAYDVKNKVIDETTLSNYYGSFSPGLMPMEASIAYLGIDVQRNRLAFVQTGFGRSSNAFVCDWFEIFGEVCSFESKLWQEAADIVRQGMKHIAGKDVAYLGVGIDCQDGITAEYVYAWIAMLQQEGYPVYGIRGVNSLEFSNDPIYSPPSALFSKAVSTREKTLAESYGVIPYKMGTHACQSKVMLFLENGTKKDDFGQPRSSEVLHFTRYEREDFLAQMTSCMLVPVKNKGIPSYKWQLISGQRSEALACVKMCFWLATKDEIFGYNAEDWRQVESLVY